MKLVTVGTVAFDDIETPRGRAEMVIGGAATYISRSASFFVENQGINSDFYSDVILRGGAAYLINKNLQVDASISGNFKNSPSVLYGGVGVSWRYDARYKDVVLKTEEEKKAQEVAKKTKTKKGFNLFKKKK